MKNEFDDDDDGDKGDVIWAIQEKNRAKGVADLSIMCEYFIHTYVHTYTHIHHWPTQVFVFSFCILHFSVKIFILSFSNIVS